MIYFLDIGLGAIRLRWMVGLYNGEGIVNKLFLWVLSFRAYVGQNCLVLRINSGVKVQVQTVLHSPFIATNAYLQLMSYFIINQLLLLLIAVL